MIRRQLAPPGTRRRGFGRFHSESAFGIAAIPPWIHSVSKGELLPPRAIQVRQHRTSGCRCNFRRIPCHKFCAPAQRAQKFLCPQFLCLSSRLHSLANHSFANPQGFEVEIEGGPTVDTGMGDTGIPGTDGIPVGEIAFAVRLIKPVRTATSLKHRFAEGDRFKLGLDLPGACVVPITGNRTTNRQRQSRGSGALLSHRKRDI